MKLPPVIPFAPRPEPPAKPSPAGLPRLLARIGAIKARFRRVERFPSALARQGGSLGAAGRLAPPRIREAIRSAAARHQIAPDLLVALAEAESGLRADAVSPSGALGLLQLMPATARRFGLANAFDLDANADAGARYLREQLDRFGWNIPLALAAYNAGPAAVLRYRGIPPYAETRRLVSRVLRRLAESDSAAPGTAGPAASPSDR